MVQIPVIDVFAGPGGLNEGFSAVRDAEGNPAFRIAASFEMEDNAVQTLRMRATVRALSDGPGLPRAYANFLEGRTTLDQLRSDPEYAAAHKQAAKHVHQIELGEPNREVVAERIRDAVGDNSQWVLIGGPPCQAYSLVGRARRTNDETFEDDHKHFLYREYLDILQRFRPSVFVMENVKGLLSAGHGGTRMFDRIMDDLRMDGTYNIRSLVVPDEEPGPKDFVIRSEEYGIPQRRHRVILLGIRCDLPHASWTPLTPRNEPVTVRQTISGLPRLQSLASRSQDPGKDRTDALIDAKDHVRRHTHHLARLVPGEADMPPEFRDWIRPNVPVTLHEPRRHMKADLIRYGFLAGMAEYGIVLRVQDFPSELLPNHRNIDRKDVPFADRFKVQQWDQPSTTVTSHIAKDGHYYIHPDPEQMRSLTVREAARLQTFPDDYYFCGNRTAQYHQVGNAVPPLLAHQIAEKVATFLGA